MQYAVNDDRRRIEAFKGGRALCPICEGQVLAKCGEIMVHHWAHEAGLDCDGWFEPETEWHRAWKALFPPESVEVPFGEHRADILTRKGVVIELQNSSITGEEIRARENCYKRMVWIVNATQFADRLFLMERYGESNCFKLRWKSLRPTWQFAKKPVYLDLGPGCLSDLMGRQVLSVHEHPGIPMQKRIERSMYGSIDVGNFGSSSLLLLNTLHAKGWGSVKAMRRDDLLAALGAPNRSLDGFSFVSADSLDGSAK